MDRPGPGNRANAEYWFDEGCFISEWSNSAADPDLSVARARLPPGATTRRHGLVGTIERYVILSGRGRVEIGAVPPSSVARDDLVIRDLGPGDVVLIAAGVSQRISNLGDDDLVFLALCTPRFERAAYRDLEGDEAAGPIPPPPG